MKFRLDLWAIFIGVTLSVNPAMASDYDVDGNGEADALTDGILVLRHQFGLSGSALTDGVLASDAAVTDADEIASYIDQRPAVFDLDGNGSGDALTDGLLLMRHLFGLSGEAMTSGVIGAGATRVSYADILAYISSAAVSGPVFISSSSFSVIDTVTWDDLAIGTVSASSDEADTLSFSVSGTELVISSSGALSFASAPDYGVKSFYSATVTVTNGTDLTTQDIVVSINSLQGLSVDYYADPETDPEHIPGTFLAHHCHYFDEASDSHKLLSDANLTEAQRQATYAQHQTVVIPEGQVGLQCEADWSVDFKLYVSGWAGQERKDLGIYGLSFFSRIFKDADVRSEAQAGIWGQWLTPNNSHPFSSLGSIEGGIFSDDKMGRSYYPKYMASGATHLYNGNSSIMGWGFYEKRVGCGYLGGVQIANTFVVPPNLISFDEDQETHEDEGGLFFGHAWIALPFVQGKERKDWTVQGGNADTSNALGKLSWTFFAEAKNFSGPVYAYVPEFWYRRLDKWNALEVLLDSDWDSSLATTQPLKDFIAGRISRDQVMSVITEQDWYANGVDEYEAGHYWSRAQDSFAFTPAGRISIGAERDNSPVFKDVDENGDIYVKAFLPKVPSLQNIEPHSLSARSYGVEAYNHFVAFFDGDVAASSLATDLNAFTHPVELNSWGEAEMTEPGEFKFSEEESDLESDSDDLVFQVGMTMKVETVDRGVNLFYDWRNRSDRGLSQYYRVTAGDNLSDYQFLSVNENAVPERLKSLTIANKPNPTSLMPHVKTSRDIEFEAEVRSNTAELFETDDNFIDYSCWVCVEANGCDSTEYVTVMDDGSKVKYRWYRFKDQPTFKNLKADYPEIYTEAYLSSLQSRVEDMQQNWINKPTDFLSKPATANNTNVNLIEIDHGHIVQPPAGKETGWVPIVLSVEIPYGKWQSEINTIESANRKLISEF